MLDDLVIMTPAGLYCPAGDFYIDPGQPQARAVITHAHADHVCRNSQTYVTVDVGEPLLRHRLGQPAQVESWPYGKQRCLGPVAVSFHPSGHVWGAAQVRLEYQGKVWVIAGEFKRHADPTCEPFEVVPCDTLIIESTFADPRFQWPCPETVIADLVGWWQQVNHQNQLAVVGCHALGKAQRLLSLLQGLSHQPIGLHPTIASIVACYVQEGQELGSTIEVTEAQSLSNDLLGLLLVPPSVLQSPWLETTRPVQRALVSGWIQSQVSQDPYGDQSGFILSDHADWSQWTQTIVETTPKQVKLLAAQGRSPTEAMAFLQDADLAFQVWTQPSWPFAAPQNAVISDGAL